jgi:hypothetical protein
MAWRLLISLTASVVYTGKRRTVEQEKQLISEQHRETETTMLERPTTNNCDDWCAYWKAQGTPWRTEPKIDQEREEYLTERCAVNADIEKGIYPFQDENGNIELTRADMEWLLCTLVNAVKKPALVQKRCPGRHRR